ncbi:EexN family lipoprotein [Escherichia coli]
MRKLATLMFMCFALSACNEKVYDVSYYSEHLDEAAKVMEQCKAGTVTDDNCKNAAEALSKKKGGDFRKKMLQ